MYFNYHIIDLKISLTGVLANGSGRPVGVLVDMNQKKIYLFFF